MSELPQRTARFMQDINDDLESGSVSFPTCVEAIVKIRGLLDDPALTTETLARAVATEPLLATKLIRLANSAALHPGGEAVSDVRKAITRVGFAQVRTLVVAVALDQLRQARELGPLAGVARRLWQHSVNVAALAYVLARKLTRVNPDAALFAGIVHDIGQFYLLSRAHDYPELMDDTSELSALLYDLHEAVGHAVLESLSTPQDIIEAVDDHESLRTTFPPASLGDVVFIANQMAAARNPFSHMDEYSKKVMREAVTFGWDEQLIANVVAESEAEMRSVMAVLDS